MTIKFSCECGKTLQVADQYAGKKARCPGCGLALPVPQMDGAVIAERPPPLPVSIAEAAPPEKPKARPKPPPLPEPEDEAVRELTDLYTHGGAPISEDDDFFVEAPPEIGRVTSAFTSLKKDQKPGSLLVRALVAALVLFASFAIIAVTVAAIRFPIRLVADDIVYVLIIPGLIGALFAALAFWWTRFSHVCSYIGVNGIAYFQCSGRRGRLTRSDLFLFEKAADLRIGQTRHFYNGAYTGTTYKYTWTNSKGKVVFVLKGRYKSEAGTPKVSDPFHFANAADSAWSNYLLENIDRVTADEDLLFFGLTGGNYVQLGEKLFILVQGNKAIELEPREIEQITIDNGIIHVREVGGKQGWFGNKGVHQFQFHELSNARFFIFALEKKLGIRI